VAERDQAQDLDFALGDAVGGTGDDTGSPLGIALQLGMLAGIVLLVRVDWAAMAARRVRSSPS
jgi:hypothetical protein